MLEKNRFNIINANNDEIEGEIIVKTDSSDSSLPIVFLLHGFKANRHWGFFPYVADSIAKSGAILISFSFSLSGIVDNEKLVYDIDKFARNTISREIEDFEFILKKLNDNSLLSSEQIKKWNGKIFVVGHSRGAAVALLESAKRHDISGLVSIASIAKTDRYSERQKELWRKKTAFEFALSQTKQRLRLDVSYLEDVELNFPNGTIENAVEKLTCPLLVIHGLQDMTVGKDEAYSIAYAYKDKSKLKFELIEKAGHGFGANHPFDHSNQSLDRMIELIIEFIEIYK